MSARVDIFVYGTLKEGEENHARFCRGVLRIEPAVARGRLFHLPAGYPALAVPPASVLHAATADAEADSAALSDWNRRLAGAAAERFCQQLDSAGERVAGELLRFDRGARLGLLDELEGFAPGRPSLFRRVLIQVRLEREPTCRAAWTYVQESPRGRLLPHGSWPAPSGRG